MWSRMDESPDNDHHLEYYTAAGRVEGWLSVSMVQHCTISPLMCVYFKPNYGNILYILLHVTLLYRKQF